MNGATGNPRHSAASESSWDQIGRADISKRFNSPSEPRQGLSSHSTQQMDGRKPSQSQSGEPQSQQTTDADTQVPRQITYLITLTDQVLTKRTQLEHEEGTLNQHQQFLNESSHSLLEAFIKHLPRMESGIDTTEQRRIQGPEVSKDDDKDIDMPQPPPPPAQIDRHELESGGVPEDAPLEALGDNSSTLPSDKAIHVLWAHYTKYQNDYDALHLRRDKVAALRNDLTLLEYRLRKRQDEFLEALKSMRSEMPQFGSQVLERASEAMGEFVPSEPSKSDAPSLLAMYFDRKGDVGVFRDRLIELDYYYQEGLVERELIKDRHDELENTDEQFRDEYIKNRRKIESDLQAAEQDVADLTAKCHAAGIEITNTVRRASSSLEEWSLRRSGSQPDIDDPITTAAESKAGKRRKYRIEGWLEDIPVGTHTSEDEDHSTDAVKMQQEPTVETAQINIKTSATGDATQENAPHPAVFDDL